MKRHEREKNDVPANERSVPCSLSSSGARSTTIYVFYGSAQELAPKNLMVNGHCMKVNENKGMRFQNSFLFWSFGNRINKFQSASQELQSLWKTSMNLAGINNYYVTADIKEVYKKRK